jgi:uncharacterized protein YndB with AHSA1/START domain
MPSVSVSRDITAPPDRIWALVTDLPRMGEWSPENTGGRWTKGAATAALGATFQGTNSSGKRRWKTVATVTSFDEPRRFAFDVAAGPLKIARWAYDIEATPTGSRVTETWTDQRGWLITKLGGFFSGVSDRPTFNRSSMEQTLAALDAAV